MANTARYATPRRTPRQLWRGWSRARKAGTLIVAVILATAVAAVAALLLRAPITGSADVFAPTEVQWDTEAAVSAIPDGELAACTANVVSPTELNITLEGLPGDSCRVTAKVSATSDTVAVVVQDLEFGPGVAAGFTTDKCGMTISVDDSTSIGMVYTLPADAEPGLYPADGEAGLIVVPESDYVDGDCPRA